MIKEDFKKLEIFLTTKGYINSNNFKASKNSFRKIHERIYSLVVWVHKLEYSDNKIVYLRELVSDAIQSIPVFALGFPKPGFLLVRGCIESLFKHIYYFDHPVEYALLSLEPKSYLTIKELGKYIKGHPSFRSFEHIDDFVNSLIEDYFELSKKVHSTDPSVLELLEALDSIEFDKVSVDNYVNVMTRVTGFINGLLVIFHGIEFHKFQDGYRKIIINTINRKFRRPLSSYY